MCKEATPSPVPEKPDLSRFDSEYQYSVVTNCMRWLVQKFDSPQARFELEAGSFSPKELLEQLEQRTPAGQEFEQKIYDNVILFLMSFGGE